MKLTPITISFVILSCLAGPRTSSKSHEFKDGFVERSVAIIVRDRTVHVEYSIGFNETTAREVVSQWEKSDPRTGIHPDLAAPVNRKPAPPPSKADTAQPTQSANPAVSSPSRAIEKNGDVDNGEAGHVISPELMKRLKRHAPRALGQGMQIHCDGKPVDISQSSAGPPPRHPFTLSVAFQFELPDSNTCELELVDRNFASRSGAYKHAAKTKGRAMIMRSNVAPILVRAERVEIKEPDKSSPPAIKLGLGFAPKSTR